MNSQTLKDVLHALEQPEVYSWIISVIGSTLTSFIPEKDENKKEIEASAADHLIAILLGTLVARFGSVLIINYFDTFKQAPIFAYLLVGLIGNAIAQGLIRFARKLFSDISVETIYDILKAYLIKKFKKQE